MKKLKYLFLAIIVLTIGIVSYKHIDVNADSDFIYGNSVYRSNATTAMIRFNSTFNGTYYYLVTSNSDVPSTEDIKAANNSAEAVEGLNIINIDNLVDGKQYCHIIVSDDTKDSNILTISMPYNVYYFDDFECYDENTTVSSGKLSYTLRYNGTGEDNQKVISSEQLNGSVGKVLQLNGRSSWSSEVVYNIVPDDKQFIVLEMMINPVSGSFPGWIGLGASAVAGGWTHSVFLAGLQNNGILYGMHDDSRYVNTDIRYSSGTWYTFKIELDRENNIGYISLNDVLISEEGYQADPAESEWFAFCAGNDGTNLTYYDNVKLYSTNHIDEHRVTFNPNGGSAVERQTGIPHEGYATEPTPPTKTNAAFAGWYSDEALTVPFSFDTPIVRDITLFAKWEDVVNYDLWISNTQVSNANAWNVLGDGKVSYSVDTNTITLNNASITGAGDETTGYGIKYSGTQDLNITANGNNTIVDNGTRSDSSTGLLLSNTTANVAINVNADSTITIAGADNSANSSGIASTGDVTINNNGTIDITGGNDTSYSYGINTQGNILINGGKTNVIASTATNESIALNANGNITLNSGELFAKTTSELETGKALSKPIVLNNGIVAGASNSILGSDIELYNNTINTYKWFEAPFDESRIIVPDTPSDEVVKGESEETGENESSVNPKTLDKIDAYIGVLFTSSISLLILWLKLKFINKIHS